MSDHDTIERAEYIEQKKGQAKQIQKRFWKLQTMITQLQTEMDFLFDDNDYENEDMTSGKYLEEVPDMEDAAGPLYEIEELINQSLWAFEEAVKSLDPVTA